VISSQVSILICAILIFPLQQFCLCHSVCMFRPIKTSFQRPIPSVRLYQLDVCSMHAYLEYMSRSFAGNMANQINISFKSFERPCQRHSVMQKLCRPSLLPLSTCHESLKCL
jgi:hypothetical protein